MATIDLGKIKFNWRGTYAGGTAYVPDDVVYYMDGSVGSSYMCVANTTGNAPSSGGTLHASWQYLAKGQATSPTTTQGDIIVRGASADGRLAIGSAGQFVKVNSGANGLEYGTVVQNFTNTAIFQYSHNSSFRSYSGEVSLSGNNNVQLQYNQVYDAGDILASSASNKFSVNATGFYVAQTHWTSHQPAHFRWPYLYNRTDSKAVGAPPVGNAMNSLTTSQHGMVCYQTGQGGGSTFGEPYYLETGKEYDWRYSSDGGENQFSTSTSHLSGSYTLGGVTQQNVVFRAQLTQMGV